MLLVESGMTGTRLVVIGNKFDYSENDGAIGINNAYFFFKTLDTIGTGTGICWMDVFAP